MLLDLPPRWERTGSFKADNGPYLEARVFRGYIDRLKAAAETHNLDRKLMVNGGSAATPYTFQDVPRVQLKGAEKLELLVEAYEAASEDYGNGMITIYSTNPEKARQILASAFTSAEFGEPTPLVTRVKFSEGVPAEDVVLPAKMDNLHSRS